MSTYHIAGLHMMLSDVAIVQTLIHQARLSSSLCFPLTVVKITSSPVSVACLVTLDYVTPS